MSFSGVLTTASLDISPATYSHRVAVACSDSITVLSELVTHSNNNAIMHAIHLNLQNSIFIAMCKCTVLFLNIVLKGKEIYYNIYFAPETDLYLQVGDRGGDNKMSTLSPTPTRETPPAR